LEVSESLGFGGWGWFSGGVGSGIGGVEHSHSRGSLRDSTVDIRSDVNGTRKGEFLSTSSGSWLLDPLDSDFSNSFSYGSGRTKLGLGNRVDSINGGST